MRLFLAYCLFSLMFAFMMMCGIAILTGSPFIAWCAGVLVYSLLAWFRDSALLDGDHNLIPTDYD